MVERIRFEERFDLADFHEAVKGRIDRNQGIIRDVRLMGLVSKNRRRYTIPDPALFEGVPIRLNHHGKEGVDMPTDPPFEGVWATAKNIKVSADGVRGDVHYNKAHPWVETILWWAENQSNIGGFSPVTWGMHSDQNGERVIMITQVESIDLVDRPATTNGIFERENTDMDPKEILKLQESLVALNAKVAENEGKLVAAATALEAAEKRATEAEAKLTAQEAAQKAAERKASREAMLAAAKLPEDVVTEAFKEAVVQAATDEGAKALIETVAKAAGSPRSESKAPDGNTATKPVYESYEAAEKAGAFRYQS